MFSTKEIKVFLEKIWLFISLSSQALLFELSGYLAYATLLSFFPFLIFLVALGNVILPPDIIHQALAQIYTTAPKEVADTIVPIIQEVTKLDNSKILTFSFLGTIWVASAGVDALRSGLNRAFQCDETRPYIQRKLTSLGYVIILAIAMMTIFPLAVIIPIISDLFHINLGYLEWLLRYVFTGFIFTGIWAFIYSHLPNRRFPFAKQVVGAASAAIAWLLLAELFSTYLTHFNKYSIIYGSLSGVIITLLFFQLSAYIILMGAQINAFLLKRGK